MEDKFLKLNKEKQDKIIRAAMQEFAANAYEKASTDRIVQAAGISKGSLFGYFGSKGSLYTDIVEMAFKSMSGYIKEKLETTEIEDFYDVLSKITLFKYEYMGQFPLETKILIYFQKQDFNEETDITALKQKYAVWEKEIIERFVIPHLKQMKLRAGVKEEEVIFIIYTVMQAVLKQEEEMQEMTKHMTQRDAEMKKEKFDKYLNLIKYGVCEKE